ncbi:hypothetical protein BAE44_0022801 [Dichanthelium oligosanthes]|uniref:Uncharacterized protein n=1 Tax=Dichanthelium oligosanthes TaxID=888268 RepID=A0A1E5UTJ1_9POAL|nr:hypothetical protein BAE44_0022801 [Dichanthelium oligosanthes]
MEARRAPMQQHKVLVADHTVDLLNLGGGRFCIATVIRVNQTVSFNCEGETTTEEEFVLLGGVEVVRSVEGEAGGLRMVKHKSKRYKFIRDKIRWVL